MRQAVTDLRTRIDAYNEGHERPREESDREVTVYVGQFVKTSDEQETTMNRPYLAGWFFVALARGVLAFGAGQIDRDELARVQG